MKTGKILWSVFLFGLILSWAEASSIQGTWKGIAPDGSTVTYVFYKDGNVDWILEKKGKTNKIKGKYKFNPNTTPMELDIFEFDLERIKSFIFLGIVEFIDENSMKMFGAASPEGTRKRPTSFGKKTIIFKKI